MEKGDEKEEKARACTYEQRNVRDARIQLRPVRRDVETLPFRLVAPCDATRRVMSRREIVLEEGRMTTEN